MRNYTLVTELTSYAIFKTDTLPMLFYYKNIFYRISRLKFAKF